MPAAASARLAAVGALVAASGALAVGGAGTAAAEPMPRGRISGQVGLKAATGGFASRLGLGWAVGVEAAYQPLRADQSIGYGLSWSTTWSFYGDGSARVSDALAMLELGAGIRARVPLGVRRRQVLFLGGGAALIRANEPPLIGGDRSYVGPWATAGLEGVLFGFQLGLEARYVVIGTDDGTIGLLLSVGIGS